MDGLWRDLLGTLFGVKAPLAAPEVRDRRKDRRAAASIRVTLEWLDAREQTQRAEGVLENVSAQGFAVRTRAELLEGQTVWIMRPASPALKSIVRHVQQEDGVFVVGMAQPANERRREDRSPVGGAGTLRLTGPKGKTVSMDVEIRNVSTEGVQLACAHAVPKKEIVRLAGDAVECIGTVRYCVPWNGKFLAGLYLVGNVRPHELDDELLGD